MHTLVNPAENRKLIEERTGAKPGSAFGAFISLTPTVRDIAEKFGVLGPDNVRLLVVGTIRYGGSGCACPANTLIRSLLRHITMVRGDVVVMDMEAGIEHLGRGTARAVDKLIVVVEPGRRSLDTAENIKRLAAEIGLTDIAIVGNKIRSSKDEKFLMSHLNDFEFLGFIPYQDTLIEADLNGISPFNVDSPAKTIIGRMIEKL